MSEPARQIKGRRDYKMDPKFRVSVPSEWRPVPGEKLNLLSSFRHDLPVVLVLTEEEFTLRLTQIENDTELTVADKREVTGALNSRCLEVSVNDQGKILIPKDCSERAGLQADGEVVLLGRGKFFEIWAPGHYSKVEQRENERLAALNQRLMVL